jgi:hypothetical protein
MVLNTIQAFLPNKSAKYPDGTSNNATVSEYAPCRVIISVRDKPFSLKKRIIIGIDSINHNTPLRKYIFIILCFICINFLDEIG